MLWQSCAAEGAAQDQTCVLVAEPSKQHGTCCEMNSQILPCPASVQGAAMCALPCNTGDPVIASMLASHMSVYRDVSQGYVKSTSASLSGAVRSTR